MQVAACFPDISLSATLGYSGDALGTLVKAANKLWSLGASATETLFDGGLRGANVAAARAAYDAGVASYRQTVLTAFQQVVSQLAALRVLEQQAEASERAVRSAQRSVQFALNTYRAGTAAYTSVITQQTALLTKQEHRWACKRTAWSPAWRWSRRWAAASTPRTSPRLRPSSKACRS